jgi:hypothetical protein
VDDVGRWLDSLGEDLGECKQIFSQAKINGVALLELSAEDLKDELNLPLGFRKHIAKAIKELQENNKK